MSTIEDYKDDFIASENITNIEAADNLIASICWDNWCENDEYFKVEAVIWNRLMSINEDEDNDEKEDVYEQVKLYFDAVGENVENLENIDFFILEKYFEEITIEYATYESFLHIYNKDINSELTEKIKMFLKDNHNAEMHILMDDDLTSFEAVLIDINTSNDFVIMNSDSFENSLLAAQKYSEYLNIEFDLEITKEIFAEKNNNYLREYIKINSTNQNTNLEV